MEVRKKGNYPTEFTFLQIQTMKIIMKQIHPLQNMTIQSVYLARSVLVNFININVDKNQIKLTIFTQVMKGNPV